MVGRSITLLSKRVPLIKFRKGGNSVGASSGISAAPTISNQNQSSAAPAIEDWQLPQKYMRKPIDEIEMQYINNGGIA